jgi:hypothetical protein
MRRSTRNNGGQIWIPLTANQMKKQADAMRRERAVLDIYTIAQRFADRRTGEDVMLEALRRWRDTDVF